MRRLSVDVRRTEMESQGRRKERSDRCSRGEVMLHVSADEISRNQDCEGGRKEHEASRGRKNSSGRPRGDIVVAKEGRYLVGREWVTNLPWANCVLGISGSASFLVAVVMGWRVGNGKVERRRRGGQKLTRKPHLAGSVGAGVTVAGYVKGLSPARLKWTKGVGEGRTAHQPCTVVITENAYWMLTLCLKTRHAGPKPSGLSAP